MSIFKNNKLAKAALLGAASVIAFAPMAPAFAATTSDYGVWSEPTFDEGAGTYSGTIDFAGTEMPDATVVTEFTVADSSNSVESHDAVDEWISEATPFGEVFGASGTSEATNFAKLGVAGSDDPYINSTTTITFDSAVPADTMGIVIGDLDIDGAVVSAVTSAGTALTGEELLGSADPTGFNLCNVTVNVPNICEDVTDKTDVPLSTVNANDVSYVNSEVGEDIGVAAWLKPSVEIKTLTIVHQGQGSESTIRVWLAGPQLETLADTGVDSTMLLTYAAIFSMLGAGSVTFGRFLKRH